MQENQQKHIQSTHPDTPLDHACEATTLDTIDLDDTDLDNIDLDDTNFNDMDFNDTDWDDIDSDDSLYLDDIKWSLPVPRTRIIRSKEEDEHTSIFYEILEDGTLILSGNDALPKFPRLRPWDNFCDQITSLVVEDGIPFIPVRYFRDYKNLKKVVLAKSVRVIQPFAFAECTALSHVEISGRLHVNYHRNPKYPRLPYSNREVRLECHAFYGTPWSLKKWGDFYIRRGTLIEYFGTSLTPLIPDGVECIGYRAFTDLLITAVTLPESLKEIGMGAFDGTRLSSITIPAAVEHIRFYAFINIPCLEHVYILGANTELDSCFSIMDTHRCPAHAPKTVIHAPLHSAAHEFALYYNMQFEPLEENSLGPESQEP